WTGVSTAAQSIPPRIPCVLAAPTPANSPTQQTLAPLAAPPTPNFFSFEQSAPESATSHHTRRISRTSRASLTHSNQNSAGSKRSSVRSSSRAPPLTPLLTAQRPLSAPMYNDTSMQQGTGSSSSTARAPFQRSSAYDEEQQLPQQEQQQQLLSDTRSRSPSIFLEPPTPDPTHAHFGPGWGRPMSPMDLPPEHTSNSSKSPSGSKSRLRPKLHIPLGRLGRSTSSDTRERESSRLREDVHVHVENPVFSSENLRQNNFDAFFEAREPVIKLKPRTPHTAPAGVDVPLERYAGVYDSPRTRSAASSSAGGLFARSPREEREHALNARSRSADHWDEAGATGSGAGGAAGAAGGGAPSKDSLAKSSSGRKNRSYFGWRGRPRGGSLSPQGSSMASYNGVLKDYSHSSLNEAFKSQNNVNFKLIKTVSDFNESLSQLYEEHATALQTLVSNYRKKNAELRKERPACHLAIFQAWETFLQETETDSQACNDVASVLSRQVSRPMLDKSFHRKVQSRKIFTHRESFETIIAKTEEKLSKCRLDYKQCYVAHRQNPSQHSLTEYIDAHNAYVQQLHATNGMLEAYHGDTLPQLMQELEEIHNDLCNIVSESLLQGADVIASKSSEQAKRYASLTSQCSAVLPQQDLLNFVRLLAQPSQACKIPRRVFAPPQAQQPGEPAEEQGDYNEMTPSLRNELVFDRHSTLSQRSALESLKREAIELELQIRQLQDSIDALNRTQTRGIEGQLYNKVNELQEDLSMKKFDLRAKQIH
ncbi:CG43729, partial [Drosophila busckii]